MMKPNAFGIYMVEAYNDISNDTLVITRSSKLASVLLVIQYRLIMYQNQLPPYHKYWQHDRKTLLVTGDYIWCLLYQIMATILVVFNDRQYKHFYNAATSVQAVAINRKWGVYHELRTIWYDQETKHEYIYHTQ